jgi:hypothetical protein
VAIDYKKLKGLFTEYVDNIDGWLELGDDDMIEKCLDEIKGTLRPALPEERKTPKKKFFGANL